MIDSGGPLQARQGFMYLRSDLCTLRKEEASLNATYFSVFSFATWLPVTLKYLWYLSRQRNISKILVISFMPLKRKCSAKSAALAMENINVAHKSAK